MMYIRLFCITFLSAWLFWLMSGVSPLDARGLPLLVFFLLWLGVGVVFETVVDGVLYCWRKRKEHQQ